MLDGLTPDFASRLVLAIGGVGVAFVVLILVLIFLKRRNSPLFIKGGKSREARLLVLDAAAIDPKRRLVLIKRDDVEHLIMIGGPTDIVIESGITDRTKSLAPARNVAVEEIFAAQPEPAPVKAVAERRPEPVRQAEVQQPVAQPAQVAEPRAVPSVAQPTVQPAMPIGARSAAQASEIKEKLSPATDRLVERPQIERPSETGNRDVSSAGAMLYGEDAETVRAAPAVHANPQASAVRQEPALQVSSERREAQVATAAESALDAVRARVMPNPQPVTVAQSSDAAEAEKAIAARLEAARIESMRRAQASQTVPSAQANPSSQAVQSNDNPMRSPMRSAIQPTIQRQEPRIETPKAADGAPSDFEKLLEAELDANGVFGMQSPQVRGETRVTSAAANTSGASSVAPPVRVTPTITGASADLSSEEEVARLLGEIAVNRKT